MGRYWWTARCTEAARDISRFQSVVVDGQVLQWAEPAHYLMLNKPAGYLSATRDPIHPTVMELVSPELRDQLHIAGRLDRASTGLIILTNDGDWSRRLTEPGIKVPKVYRVTTARPVDARAVQRFSEGIWFAYEELTTSPATLEPLALRGKGDHLRRPLPSGEADVSRRRQPGYQPASGTRWCHSPAGNPGPGRQP